MKNGYSVIQHGVGGPGTATEEDGPKQFPLYLQAAIYGF